MRIGEIGHLTTEAKALLAKTVRRFREAEGDPNGGLLLRGLREQARSEYRLDIADIARAELAQAQRARRERLEDWLEEQARAELESQKAQGKVKNEQAVLEESKERHLTEAIKLAGATLLNRLVVIMQLEAMGQVKPAVVTGGLESSGYRDFRDYFGPELCKGERDGYGFLLGLLYDELAVELPGVFGKVGITELFSVPVSTLRAVVEALNDEGLASAWTDDTTLGWVYQYWNDPEREALDAKLNSRGKLEPHEIASKTQMFTERYMVEWLLQNSLNQQWLAICEKNGWVPGVEKYGTLAALEEKRSQWREQREKGEVALDALMPIGGEQEQRWKYWVPQPRLGVEGVPGSIRDLKIFDPACGSGHFLIIAFDLLFVFYGEEAYHRGELSAERWSDQAVVESILENNLFGLDLDPRAVQIAAAALYLKAKGFCEAASPRRLNLVASSLNLAALPVDDPARVELRVAVAAETGIPGSLTDEIVEALKGADAWGSLLQVDAAVEEAIERPVQESLLEQKEQSERSGAGAERTDAKAVLLEKLEDFLTRRTRSDDLGLRLRGEQLAAGVRFIRMVAAGAYDLVVGNPPYQGTSRLKDADYVKRYYPDAKADLYAAFLERGLQLAKRGGLSALLTMRNWMFISQYSKVRESLLEKYDLRLIGDLETGAFEEVSAAQVVLSVAMTIFCRDEPTDTTSIALQPAPGDTKSEGNIERKRAGLLAQVGRFEFKTNRFDVIKEKPLIYWWDDQVLDSYEADLKLDDAGTCREGLGTRNDTRYLRKWWEISSRRIEAKRYESLSSTQIDNFEENTGSWHSFIKGAEGKVWFEPLEYVIDWYGEGLEIATFQKSRYGRGADLYHKQGIAITTVGNSFKARIHRYSSIFGDAGVSFFSENLFSVLCSMNSEKSRFVLNSLNPSISFKVNDIRRLPLFPIESADQIFTQLETAFTTHEAAREPSVEFQQPGPTCWPYAQAWAQRAVDRPAGEPLPDWEPEYEEPKPTDYVSYAIGLAMGRFPLTTREDSQPSSNDSRPSSNDSQLPSNDSQLPSNNSQPSSNDSRPSSNDSRLPSVVKAGILYLSAYSKGRPTSPDSLSHTDNPNDPAAPIHQAWATHHSAITPKNKDKDLHTWLRLHFFPDVHLDMYEKRPIYFPLSSQNKNFVAHISIHRWQPNTLKTLLADYLTPDLRTLEGELSDLESARTTAIATGNSKAKTDTSNQQDHFRTLHSELTAFIALVRQCAETGPLPANPNDPIPEAPTPYRMTLDDGVMINSAALWPLLHPQWSKPAKNSPKNWWHELTTAQGRKDYDWSHLAARYFPIRVDAKCQKDPSLAVAHGCFWKYHPAKAYEWELRLQDEIAPDFTIDEADSDTLRQQFESQHPDTIQELKAKEEKRRERKHKKQEKDQFALDV
ncbi:MAG: BREX-6 system adenine-specific DNA-methyltransferase PglX [Cyanobacteria bacterium J06627_28]